MEGKVKDEMAATVTSASCWWWSEHEHGWMDGWILRGERTVCAKRVGLAIKIKKQTKNKQKTKKQRRLIQHTSVHVTIINDF